MPSIFYEIFNEIITLNADNLTSFIENLKDLYKELESRNDVDNLKVLKNRLLHVLHDHRKQNLDKKTKKWLKKVDEIIEDIDDFIDLKEKGKWQEVELVDVVKEVEKKYKECRRISPEKKEKYIPVCIKKSEVEYETKIIELQLELVKLQKYIKESGKKLLIIFEGRDASGKGGNIKRFTEYLNPRSAKVVALEKPSDIEKTQWYFQRYISHLPNGGEMVFFDRSWYNRGGVEPVMGFCKKKEYEQFMDDVPKFEKMLSKSGITVIKFYFSVSKDIQKERFDQRRVNPLKQFKLSPIDQFSQELWDRYTLAEYKNLSLTHSEHVPWTIVESDNKKKARLNAIRFVLNQFDYPDKLKEKKLKVNEDIVYNAGKRIKMLEKEINTSKDLFE